MANKKISDFTNKPTPSGGDKFLIEDSAGNYFYVTRTQLETVFAPVSIALSTVLSNGNKTGEQDITSDNEFSKAEIKDGQIRLYRTDGLSDFGEIKLTDLLAYLKYTGLTGNGHVTIDDLVNQISHSAEVNLSAPVINGSGELTSISPNTLGVLKALNNLAQLTVDGGGITANLINTIISHNSEIQLNAPDNTINGNFQAIATNGNFMYNIPSATGYEFSDTVAGEVNTNNTRTRAAHDLLIELNAPSVKKNNQEIATQAYVDGLVAGLLDDRGSYDASSNLFPSSGGSGTAGAILKGDIWYISVAGTLGGSTVTVGDSVRALVDTPGQTSTNWSILETNIGYVPENVANKTGTVAGNESSTTLYLHIKGFYDYLISLVWLTAQIWGTWINGLTSKTTPVDADQVVLMDSADSNKAKKLSWANIKSALASTFFLDATSSIQTQFDKIRAYIELGQTGAVTFSPIDGETRFYGMLTAGIPTTVASARALIITNNIVVKEVSVSTWVNTTVGSNEAVNIYLEEYSGTAAATLVNSTLITSSYTLDNASKQNSLNIPELNISVSAGNFIIFKVVFPNFTTNPTNMWTVFLLSVKQS